MCLFSSYPRWAGWLVRTAGVCALTSTLSAAAPALPSAVVDTRTAQLSGALPFPTNSPVRFFRVLLTASADEQVRLLEARPAASRAVLQQKLQEYRLLSDADREAKLRALEFHHLMNLLMNAPVAVRAAWLTQVPVEYRPLCEERLRLWNLLPVEIQRNVREREATFRWLTRYESASEDQRKDLLNSVPLSERTSREQALAQWRAMSAAEREQAWRGARQMFEMSARDQQRVVAAVAESNRIPTARLVEGLRQLSHQEREQCLAGWQRYAQLEPAEQARLLQAWERWKKMSESEREVWRKLSASVPKPPPLPQPRSASGTKTGALPRPGHGYAATR